MVIAIVGEGVMIVGEGVVIAIVGEGVLIVGE